MILYYLNITLVTIVKNPFYYCGILDLCVQIKPGSGSGFHLYEKPDQCLSKFRIRMRPKWPYPDPQHYWFVCFTVYLRIATRPRKAQIFSLKHKGLKCNSTTNEDAFCKLGFLRCVMSCSVFVFMMHGQDQEDEIMAPPLSGQGLK